jgi:hypothetical protein
MSWPAPAEAVIVTLKTERTGNVYENKVPLWETQGDPGMYMKTKDLSFISGYVVENKGSYLVAGDMFLVVGRAGSNVL